MQKFISQKQLYSSIKEVSDDVQNGTVFIVLKHSRPAYKIVPLNDKNPTTKTTDRGGDDFHKYIFQGKKGNKVAKVDMKEIIARNALNKGKKKHTLHDLPDFIFHSKNKEEGNLATTFKKYIY